MTILLLDKSDTRENKVCEIRLAIPGNDLFARKTAKTFDEAVGLTITTLERQVTNWKTRMVNHPVGHTSDQ